VDELQRAAREKLGYGIVMTQPEAWASEIHPCNYRSESIALMRELKARWDPQGILQGDLQEF